MESDDGYDAGVWELMSDQLGLVGLLAPISFGGSGAGPGELIAAFEEGGRFLLATPLLSSGILASTVLDVAGDDTAKSERLPAIADGTTIGTLAEAQCWTGSTEPLISATVRSDTWRLSGVLRHVLDGQNADTVFVPVRTGEGMSVYVVDPRSDSAEIRPLVTLDRSRKQADIILTNCAAQRVDTNGRGQEAVDRALALGALAVAAEALGGAERALDASLEHATHRIQFGRVIGEFQAIKHKCADMKLLLEGARAVVHNAANSYAYAGSGPYVDVSLAKLYACDAFFRIAAENLQIHGGMGCTWEHSAHLLLRRAKTLQHLLGSPAHHRSVIADHLHLLTSGSQGLPNGDKPL
jgi:alkylation response protein AidB-like acyl-CoA dehydrogenase